MTPRLRFPLDTRSPEQVFAGEPAQPAQPQPVVEPGTLPAWLLDQTEVWIDPQGYQHRIADLDREMVEWVIYYLFSYASRVRMAWSMEKQETFDTSQKARRWMMTKPGFKALIERLAVLNKIDDFREETYTHES